MQSNLNNNPQFSHYRAPIKRLEKKTKPSGSYTDAELIQLLHSDELKEITAEIRSQPTQDMKNDLKQTKLPFITVAGTFSTKNEEGLIKHSGRIAIDIDHVGDLKALQDLQDMILDDLLPTPLMFWVSPSGDGLKVIYCIDITETEPKAIKAQHRQYFKAFEALYLNELNIQIDKRNADLSRASFLCYDPDAAIYTPTVLTPSFIDNELPGQKPATYEPSENAQEEVSEADQMEFYQRAVADVEGKLLLYEEGHRHDYIFEVAGLCNRTGVKKSFAMSQLLQKAEEGHTAQEIRNTVNSVYDNKDYNGINPLKSTPAKDINTPLLPIAGLPLFIQDLINECCKVYGFHRDLWASAFMAASASAIGQSYILRTKYDNPPLFWFAVVGASGIGKTQPFNFAFAPIHNTDTAAFRDYKKLMEDFTVKEAGTKKERKPRPKLPPQAIIIDATPEAMGEGMSAREKGITIEREELAGWLADFGRYNRSGEQQTMLSTWSQSPYKVTRVSGRNHYIRTPFVSVVGGLQPKLLQTMAADGRDINGFLPRFAFIFPDQMTVPEYSYTELAYEYKAQYEEYISKLMQETSLRYPINLSKEAEKVYADFFNKNAALANGPLRSNDYAMAVNAKLNIIALRTAVLLHIMNNIHTGLEYIQISPETMQHAIDMAEYFRITQQKVAAHLTKPTDHHAMIKYIAGLGHANQSEIAKMFGVKQQTISKIISKKQT